MRRRFGADGVISQGVCLSGEELRRVTATGAYIGRNCPYCRFPLKEGGELVLCGHCHAAHHADCWDENHGCAVLGCVGAPTVVQAAAGATIPQSAAAGGGASAATGVFETAQVAPPVASPPSPQSGRRSHTSLAVAGVLLVACAIGAGLYVGGVFKQSTGNHPASSGRHRSQDVAATTNSTVTQMVTVAANTTTPATTSTPATPTQADQNAIVGQLNAYVAAWQNTSPSSLAPLLTANVVRIGSVTGNCGTTVGRNAVVNLYASSEMSSATTDYALLNTNPDIRFANATTATVNETYAFGSEQPHFVDFTFTKQNGTWLISKLHAWCHA